MYKKDEAANLEWRKKANKIAEESARFGKKIEKFTDGIIRTSSMVLTNSVVTEEDFLQPLLIIKIDMVNDKGCKEINALIEMLKTEGMRFTYAGYNNLEKLFEEYTHTAINLKKLVIELLGEKVKGA
jgi:hypothetical protein